MGFDDHGWLSDSDLKWLVDSGQADLLRVRAAAQELRAKRSGQEAQGARFDERELQKAEKEEIDLAESLRPYEEEYRRGTRVNEDGHRQSVDVLVTTSKPRAHSAPHPDAMDHRPLHPRAGAGRDSGVQGKRTAPQPGSPSPRPPPNSPDPSTAGGAMPAAGPWTVAVGPRPQAGRNTAHLRRPGRVRGETGRRGGRAHTGQRAGAEDRHPGPCRPDGEGFAEPVEIASRSAMSPAPRWMARTRSSPFLDASLSRIWPRTGPADLPRRGRGMIDG